MASSETTRNVFLIITLTIEILLLCGQLSYLPLTKDNPLGITTIVVLFSATLITGCCFRSYFYYNKIKLFIMVFLVLLISCCCCAIGIVRWLPRYSRYLETDSMTQYWSHRMNKQHVQDVFACCGPDTSGELACPYTASCQSILKAEYYLLQELSNNMMLIISGFLLIDFFVIIFTSRVSPTTKHNLETVVPDRVIILDSEGQQVGSSSIYPSQDQIPQTDASISPQDQQPVIYPDAASEFSSTTLLERSTTGQ